MPPWNYRRASMLLALLALSATASATDVHVPASAVWVDSGVNVSIGQRLRIEATGVWSNGGSVLRYVGPTGWPAEKRPGALQPDAPLGALIGRIGDRIFLVGSSYQESIKGSGRLFLSMNDQAADFADNRGSITASVTLLPPIAIRAGQRWEPAVYSFMPASQAIAFAQLAFGGGRVQLSQTGNGTPQIFAVNGATRSYMSYIRFGPFLSAMGTEGIPIDLPITEKSIDQLIGADTGGTGTLAQFLVTHSFVFVDRVRLLVNDVHAEFDNDLQVRLAAGEVVLDLALHSPDPALRGEGNGYTAAPFGIPIPLGWQDGLCPDVTFQDMRVLIHLAPTLDANKGVLALQNPRVELVGSLALSVGDQLVQGSKEELRAQVEKQLQNELSRPGTKAAIEKAITALLLGGRPNKNVLRITIDDNGIEVAFKG